MYVFLLVFILTVIVAVPALMHLIVPFFTETILLSDELHVYVAPFFGLLDIFKAAVLPTVRSVFFVANAGFFTVIFKIKLYVFEPFLIFVLILQLPAVTPVTMPFLLTVAMLFLFDEYVTVDPLGRLLILITNVSAMQMLFLEVCSVGFCAPTIIVGVSIIIKNKEIKKPEIFFISPPHKL